MMTLTRDKLESVIEDIKIMSDYPWHHKLNFILENDQAQRGVIDELRGLCLDAYQVVGSLAGDAGMFGHLATIKVLDNLGMAGTGKPLPHKKLLPFPASQKIEQQAKEIADLKVNYQREIDKRDQHIVSFGQQNKTLREALQLLYDCQNGCPLPKYEADWNRAMELAEQALKEVL